MISNINKTIQTTSILYITAIAFIEKKHNTETLRNGYLITMYQKEPLHKPYFIAINNQGQVIISPNKKIMAMHIVRELEVLI